MLKGPPLHTNNSYNPKCSRQNPKIHTANVPGHSKWGPWDSHNLPSPWATGHRQGPDRANLKKTTHPTTLVQGHGNCLAVLGPKSESSLSDSSGHVRLSTVDRLGDGKMPSRCSCVCLFVAIPCPVTYGNPSRYAPFNGKSTKNPLGSEQQHCPPVMKGAQKGKEDGASPCEQPNAKNDEQTQQAPGANWPQQLVKPRVGGNGPAGEGGSHSPEHHTQRFAPAEPTEPEGPSQGGSPSPSHDS